MRRWIDVVIAMLIGIPITKIVTDDMTNVGGFVYNATHTSVGADGTFVQLLFQWWWIGWGILLVILAVYLLRKGLAGGIDIFGGSDESKGGEL